MLWSAASFFIFVFQDAKYSALNLLSGMKWMTKKADQTAIASVDIKLDVPSVIHFIDLGMSFAMLVYSSTPLP